MFTGTLRFNLDLENKYTDQRIQELMVEAGLEDLLKKDEKGINLDI